MLYDIEGVWATWFSGLKWGPIQAQSRFLQCFVPLSGGTHISFIAALLSFLPRLYYLASTPPGNKLYRPGIVGFAGMFVGAVPAEGSNELAFTWLPQSIPQSPPGPLNWATLRPTRPGLRASLNTASPSFDDYLSSPESLWESPSISQISICSETFSALPQSNAGCSLCLLLEQPLVAVCPGPGLPQAGSENRPGPRVRLRITQPLPTKDPSSLETKPVWIQIRDSDQYTDYLKQEKACWQRRKSYLKGLSSSHHNYLCIILWSF